MTETRPDPDLLLSRVESELNRQRRGQLRIFFGYAAGVGKTYAMLQEAQRRKAAGVDVVVGYVEPHGRQETEALLAGLEVLPVREVQYRDLKLREFNLDAALARQPQLILVDELAHTNAEGLRHTKRWQDVDELLAAGIDVYTSLNVQHIESLNDVVAQITGVEVRETLPDDVFDRADEIELVDITPEQLVERLQAGKVYLPAQAQRAIQSFFQRSNLVALREISLRRSADRVGADVRTERSTRGERKTWPTTDRLLVCVSPSPQSAKLLRTAKRMASALHAEWIAVHVENAVSLPEAVHHQLINNLRLAEQLGAETVTLTGNNSAEEIVNYARDRNVTKIIAGKTDTPRWKAFLFGSFLDSLLRQSGEIDVYVIRGQGETTTSQAILPPTAFDWQPYGWTTLIVAFAGIVSSGMFWLELAEANIAMTLLLGVVLSAAWYGRWPGIYASVISVLLFDFFFVPPQLTLAISDAQYIITFAVMLSISLAISTLTARIRGQVISARQQHRRAETLYRLSKQLAAVSGSEFLANLAAGKISELFPGEVVIYLRDDDRLQPRVGQKAELAQHPNSLGVAQWVLANERTAGIGTATLPQADGVFIPLLATQSTLGVLAVCPTDRASLRSPEQRQILEACASQLALALERDQLALEASQVLLQAETERLRSSLLSSVSHDLRTPLASIAGASSTLLASNGTKGRNFADIQSQELLQSIYDESHRLGRLVDNLLEMTKIEARGLEVHRQWEVVEEIVGAALHRLDSMLAGRAVKTNLAPDLPMVQMDGLLIEQVLVNLLDNSLKYTPAGSPIDITVTHDTKRLIVSLADRGPGISTGDEKRIFEKFYRGVSSPGRADRRGSGLGLAICKAIVETHGGEIHAENRAGGGACFTFTLPADSPPPVTSEMPALDRPKMEVAGQQ